MPHISIVPESCLYFFKALWSPHPPEIKSSFSSQILTFLIFLFSKIIVYEFWTVYFLLQMPIFRSIYCLIKVIAWQLFYTCLAHILFKNIFLTKMFVNKCLVFKNTSFLNKMSAVLFWRRTVLIKLSPKIYFLLVFFLQLYFFLFCYYFLMFCWLNIKIRLTLLPPS